MCLMQCPAIDRVYCTITLSAVAEGNLMVVHTGVSQLDAAALDSHTH